MDYLFFDIECANCFGGSGKICEFGYVITDERFEIKEKDVLLVDPNSGFDWYVAKKMLAYPKEQYIAAADYPTVFPQIERLLTRKNLLVIGHTVDADAGYLNDEARRYGLPFFNYTFYDAKEMYMAYANQAKSVGLEKTGEELGVAGPAHAHRSVDDAEATMQIVQKMCRVLGVTLPELIDLCPDCRGKTEGGRVWTPVRERAKIKREQDFAAFIAQNRIFGYIARLFVKYREGLQINAASRSPLAGKTVCFSRHYEDDHLREMMFLVKELAARGARCIGKASECDVFVRFDITDENGDHVPCLRLSAAEKARSEGADVTICTLEDLLTMAGITKTELESAPMPARASFANESRTKEKSHGSTIGEVLRASGIDLTTAFME